MSKAEIVQFTPHLLRILCLGNTLMKESPVLLLDSPLDATSCFIVIRKQFYAMWKKLHVQHTVLWLCLGFKLQLSTAGVDPGGGPRGLVLP